MTENDHDIFAVSTESREQIVSRELPIGIFAEVRKSMEAPCMYNWQSTRFMISPMSTHHDPHASSRYKTFHYLLTPFIFLQKICQSMLIIINTPWLEPVHCRNTICINTLHMYACKFLQTFPNFILHSWSGTGEMEHFIAIYPLW